MNEIKTGKLTPAQREVVRALVADNGQHQFPVSYNRGLTKQHQWFHGDLHKVLAALTEKGIVSTYITSGGWTVARLVGFAGEPEGPREHVAKANLAKVVATYKAAGETTDLGSWSMYFKYFAEPVKSPTEGYQNRLSVCVMDYHAWCDAIDRGVAQGVFVVGEEEPQPWSKTWRTGRNVSFALTA
jgi:hypothetical protein